MTREVRSLLLVLLGAAVLHISLFSDLYVRYVRRSLGPYLVVTGVILVALGVAGAVAAVRRLLAEDRAARLAREAADGVAAHGRHRGSGPLPDVRHDHDHDHHTGDAGDAGDDGDDGHGHGPRGMRMAWLLTLPVLAVFLIAPPALGSYSAARSANAVARPASAGTGFPPLPGGSPLVLPLADFDVRAVWDTSGSLRGRQVRLTGFVTPRKGGGWYVARLTISCCAADAQTYKVEVRGIAAPPADSWVEVTGVWTPDGQAGRPDAVPALTVTRLTRIPEPRDPYE